MVANGAWFREGIAPGELQKLGFRVAGGGAHQSKTMMLRELSTLLASGATDPATVRHLIMDENALGKASTSARQSVLRHLIQLYGLGDRTPVSQALRFIWPMDAEGRRLFALSCALARDPLLRDSAKVVLSAPVGARVGAPEITEGLAERHPGRFSPAMLKSLAQNCASTWTQSGHLSGKVKKLRARAKATPAVAAYSAFLAAVAGFGGPALIASPWMDVLDVSTNERLSLLRRAESLGLLHVRAAGDVVEIVFDPLRSRIEANAGHV